jgi:hypothetical protein
MTEAQLIDKLLSARTKAEYTRLDRYLKRNPKAVTLPVAQAREAYELYRHFLTPTR